jgi:hypothetical protein
MFQRYMYICIYIYCFYQRTAQRKKVNNVKYSNNCNAFL